MTIPGTAKPRYAIYFAPEHASPWWHFGAGFLGRDETRNTPLEQPAAGYAVGPFSSDAPGWAELTQEPRRYGFHATLKAPFELRCGVTATDLNRRVTSLASRLQAVAISPLVARHIQGFVALVPEQPHAAIGVLAQACVQELDDLRAPLSPSQMERRKPQQLDARGLALLTQFGYPHVMERFQFHMTMTSPVPAELAIRLLAKLKPEVQRLNSVAPLMLDRLSIFFEHEPGAPFVRLGDELLTG